MVFKIEAPMKSQWHVKCYISTGKIPTLRVISVHSALAPKAACVLALWFSFSDQALLIPGFDLD